MIINKHSLWYRWVAFHWQFFDGFFEWWYQRWELKDNRKHDPIPNNLCDFMQAALLLPILNVWVTVFWGTIFAVGTAVVVIIKWTFLALATAMTFLWERRPHRGPTTSEPQPNVAWEYIKAKKRQMCPLLTFTDDEQVAP